MTINPPNPYNLKIGDKVKQIRNINYDENPICIIDSITRYGDISPYLRVGHIHIGKKTIMYDIISSFVPYKKKVTNWRKEVEE